jgi:hypothetical protein
MFFNIYNIIIIVVSSKGDDKIFVVSHDGTEPTGWAHGFSFSVIHIYILTLFDHQFNFVSFNFRLLQKENRLVVLSTAQIESCLFY